MIDQENVQAIGILPARDISSYTRLILANVHGNAVRMDNLSLIRIPAGAKNVLDYGAVPDGAGASPTNNHSALDAAIAAAKKEAVPVYVPSGVFGYDDVLHLDGVKMVGGGATSVLMSQNRAKSAVKLTGDSPSIVGCYLQGVATSRSSQPQTTGVWAYQATNFIISANRIHDVASAGIFSYTSTQGSICGNIVSQSLADGIHHTGNSSHIQTIGRGRVLPRWTP